MGHKTSTQYRVAREMSKCLTLLLILMILAGCKEEEIDQLAEGGPESKSIAAGQWSEQQIYNDAIVLESKTLLSGSFGNAYLLKIDINEDAEIDFEIEYHHLINGENSFSKTYMIRSLGRNTIFSYEDNPALFVEGETISTESETRSVGENMYFISVENGANELEEGNWNNAGTSGYLGFILFTDQVRYIGWIHLTLNPNGLEAIDAAYW